MMLTRGHPRGCAGFFLFPSGWRFCPNHPPGGRCLLLSYLFHSLRLIPRWYCLQEMENYPGTHWMYRHFSLWLTWLWMLLAWYHTGIYVRLLHQREDSLSNERMISKRKGMYYWQFHVRYVCHYSHTLIKSFAVLFTRRGSAYSSSFGMLFPGSLM